MLVSLRPRRAVVGEAEDWTGGRKSPRQLATEERSHSPFQQRTGQSQTGEDRREEVQQEVIAVGIARATKGER
jgi:hypothetical protein